MKKIFLSPYFTPLFLMSGWVGMVLAIMISPANRSEIIEDGYLVANLTYFSYFLMILTFLWVFKLFYKENKLLYWFLYLFLGICALLREMGIQHHLSATDSTPFKSRFFLNPNNPISEKIIYGTFLLIFFVIVFYLIFKNFKHLWVTFFQKDTITWSLAAFFFALVIGKFFDRLPSNLDHKMDIKLSSDSIDIIKLIEEVSEMFLPLIVAIVLIQYFLVIKYKKK